MRSHNLLITRWQDELAAFRQQLAAYDGSDAEQLHQLRVRIKKLRAYLKLGMLISHNKNLRALFRDTDALFKVMGDHRMLDIQLSRAAELAGNKQEAARHYTAWLLRQRDGLMPMAQVLGGYDPQSLDRVGIALTHALSPLDDARLQRQSRRIGNRYMRKAGVGLRHFKEAFHQVRKDLKVVFYISGIAGIKHRRRLERLLDALGDIQDLEDTQLLLGRYRSEHSAFAAVWDAVLRQLRAEQRQRLKDTKRRLRAFVGRL